MFYMFYILLPASRREQLSGRWPTPSGDRRWRPHAGGAGQVLSPRMGGETRHGCSFPCFLYFPFEISALER